jgi:hypothetical protein
LGHHDDGNIGTDAAIGRRVELMTLLGGGAELEAAGAVRMSWFIGLRTPPNEADAGLDASRRAAVGELVS